MVPIRRCPVFAVSLLAAGVAGAQVPDGEWVSYRDAYRAMVVFEKFGGPKHLIQNHFQVMPRQKGVSANGVQLSLVGKSTRLNLPLDPLGRAVFPLLKTAYDENAVLVLNRKPGQYVLRPRDGRNGSLAPALPVGEGTIFAADPDDGFKTVFYRFAGTPARGQVVTEDEPLAIAPVLE